MWFGQKSRFAREDDKSETYSNLTAAQTDGRLLFSGAEHRAVLRGTRSVSVPFFAPTQLHEEDCPS